MVQQCRGCRRGEDRHRNDYVRSKYLQVLRFIQVDTRCTRNTTYEHGLRFEQARHSSVTHVQVQITGPQPHLDANMDQVDMDYLSKCRVRARRLTSALQSVAIAKLPAQDR